ncbi:MAG: hypothetical protein ACRCYU_10225 [Nocardioides sp.]
MAQKLKDRQGKLRILERIDRLIHGNPGDVRPVGRGVSELRLTYGRVTGSTTSRTATA